MNSDNSNGKNIGPEIANNKKLNIKLIVAVSIVAFIVAASYFAPLAIKEMNYRKGTSFIEEGNYIEAMKLLNKNTEYKDSNNLIMESKYLASIDALQAGEFSTVYYYLSDMLDYKDSNLIYQKTKYEEAVKLYEDYNTSGDIQLITNANEIISQVGNEVENIDSMKEIIAEAYKNSDFNYAVKLFNLKNFYEAREIFLTLKDNPEVERYLNSKYYKIEGTWKINTNNTDKIIIQLLKHGQLKMSFGSLENSLIFVWNNKSDFEYGYGSNLSSEKVVNANNTKGGTLELQNLSDGSIEKYTYYSEAITSNSGNNNSSTKWTKSPQSTNGNDWETMSVDQRKEMVLYVLYNWEEQGIDVKADFIWFLRSLNEFYGTDSSNRTNVAEAMSMLGAAGNVISN